MASFDRLNPLGGEAFCQELVSESVGLGVRRYSEGYVDSSGSRIFSHKSSGVSVLGEVRLDNRDELIVALGLMSLREGDINDVMIVSHAYLRWGEAFCERILGDFAIAVWDSRKAELLLVRDHMGVVPLYYFLSDRVCLFSNRISGIVGQLNRQLELDRFQVTNLMLSIFHPDQIERSAYREVSLLRNGSMAKVSSGNLAKRLYWEFGAQRRESFSSFDEFAEGFRERFGAAVKCRLPKTGLVGAELSSGLDSNSIVSTLVRSLRQGGRLRTYTQACAYQADDEVKMANRSLRELGMPETRAIRGPGKVGLLSMVESAQKSQGAPLLDTWGVYSQPLYEAAREDGVRVLLSGAGGNNLVSDFGKLDFVEFARELRLGLLWKELGANQCSIGRKGTLCSLKGGIRAIALASFPGDALWYRSLGRFKLRPHCLRLSVEEESDFEKRLTQYARWFWPRRQLEQFARVATDSCLSASRFVESASLAGARDLSVRYPLVDVKLMEYCLSAPVDYRRRDGWNRYLLRGSVDDLPACVRWRRRQTINGIPWPMELFSNSKLQYSNLVRRSGGSKECLDLLDLPKLQGWASELNTLNQDGARKRLSFLASSLNLMSYYRGRITC